MYNTAPPTAGQVTMRTTHGDITIALWSKESPLAARNFVQLCLERYYDGTIFHRVIKDFMIQGGDPTGTGRGGESVYGGRPFKDEFHTRLRFIHRGILAMANEGAPNTNGSQFFITVAPTPHLDAKHVVFGELAAGFGTLNMMEATHDASSGLLGRPSQKVVITACGELPLE